MCTGYAKEIQAWICEQTQRQSESYLREWGRSLFITGDESEVYVAGSPMTLRDTARALRAPEGQA